jgi:hypothetical protein
MPKANVDSSSSLVFDHIAIRRFIGLIAILLPLIVIIAAWDGLPDSISASYYASARFPFLPYFPSPRDIFVGALFVIGAFLMSYKGHTNAIGLDKVEALWRRLGPNAVRFCVWEFKHEEDIVSWIGGIAAWVVALFPTAKATECVSVMLFALEPETNKIAEVVSNIHISAAAILFLTTVYFCLVAFKRRLNKKFVERGATSHWYSDALQRRRFVYNLSGWVTLILIVVLGLLAAILPEGVCVIHNQTYWAETVMLELFGIAWFTASKPPFLRDPSEQKNFDGAMGE